MDRYRAGSAANRSWQPTQQNQYVVPSSSSGWLPASAFTVIPHTGSIAVAVSTSGSVPCRSLGRDRSEGAGGPQLDQLGQDRDGDLAVGGVAEVQPDGHPHPVESLAGDAAVGEVAEHGLATLPRGDQADERRLGRDRPLERLLVTVALGRDHHDRTGVEPVAGEVVGVDDHGVPVSAAARSARVWAIGERPTTVSCTVGTTGST